MAYNATAMAYDPAACPPGDSGGITPCRPAGIAADLPNLCTSWGRRAANCIIFVVATNICDR